MNELLLFAKAPRPGLVKTRLAETIGAQQACHAYQQLLRTIASRIGPFAPVTVCYSPADGADELRHFFPAHWKFRPQGGSNLGERLSNAITTSLLNGACKVAVIGSDCPYLTMDDLAATWNALDDHDVVFGPAVDGGYWLVATNHSHAALFTEIDWGTSAVLQQSLSRAAALNLKVVLLRKLADIDTIADWRAFVATQP